MQYLIIGNSYAGTSAAASIREVDRKGKILIISSETYRAYARPLISYFLAGRVKSSIMYYRDAGFYRRNNIEVMLNEKVVGVDIRKMTVRLERGNDLRYDRLLISAGGRPALQRIEGIETGNVFTFTTWNDAKRLRETIKKKRKAVVLGGGLIGMKAAEGLKACGVDVTVVISSPRVLSLILDETAGSIINRHLIKSGVRLITGRSVNEVRSDAGEVSEVVLDSGKRIECGIVIVAKGVRPNVEFIKESGISLNRGIVVDRHMMTNITGVYSAGDSAEAWDLVNMRNSVIAIAPLASEQGRIAGYNMAGDQRTYNGGMGMNSIELSGLPLMAMGISSKVGEGMEARTFRRGGIYRKLVFSQDRLVGALLVGDVRCGGVLTHLIKSQSDIRQIRNELSGHCLKTGEFGVICPKMSGLSQELKGE